LAKRDLEAARLLAQRLPEEAMFHVQQSVEKFVRALVEAEAGVAGPTHNIRALADLLPANHPLHDSLRPLHEVSLAATRYRYPTSGGTIFEHEGDVASLIKEVDAFGQSVGSFLNSKKLL
jgi:HEPN domain-containing protein